MDEHALSLLDRPLLAVLGTTDGDRHPHSVPVWYRCDGEKINVWTGMDRVWIRNVERSAAVSLTVRDSSEPFSGAVLINGKASIDNDDEARINAEFRRISERYLPAGKVEGYIARWSALRTIVSISMDRVRSWESDAP